ncbi:MAG TPA: hypothetical protein VNT92_11355, partial [Acidimicrobiia bacterium]|nr:hypothetical protein [Acidimicrobiia bacterium]
MNSELPKPTGEYAVGRSPVEISDKTRAETQAAQGDASPRKLLVWIWYPAVPSADSRYSPYLPQGWEASDTVMGAPLGTVSLQSHSQDGASPLVGHGPFPL